jgi:hypothetical protein
MTRLLLTCWVLGWLLGSATQEGTKFILLNWSTNPTILFVTTQVYATHIRMTPGRLYHISIITCMETERGSLFDRIGALIKKRSSSSSSTLDQIRTDIASDSSSEQGSRHRHRQYYHGFQPCILPHKRGRWCTSLDSCRSGGYKRHVLPQPTPSLNNAWTRT